MFGGSQKYWIPVLLAESVAVVVSILLAFAIDAWWENREERAEEQNILLGLQTEFETNLGFIERERIYRNAVLASIQQLFDASDEQISLEPETLDELIGDLYWWGQAEYSKGATENIVQGGSLSIIQNEELRSLLASLAGEFDAAVRQELQDQDTTRNVVGPFLRQNASLAQIANTMEGGTPGTGLNPVPAIYPRGAQRDHSALLNNSEFIGILVLKHWDQIDAHFGYDNMQEILERGLRLINGGLDD
jgi:hypothetical protein